MTSYTLNPVAQLIPLDKIMPFKDLLNKITYHTSIAIGLCFTTRKFDNLSVVKYSDIEDENLPAISKLFEGTVNSDAGFSLIYPHEKFQFIITTDESYAQLIHTTSEDVKTYLIF
jgi:hypothetical protein